MNVTSHREPVAHAMQTHRPTMPKGGPTSGNSNPRRGPKCSHCDGSHSIDRCYFLIGFPKGHKWHGKRVFHRNKHPPTAHNVEAFQSQGILQDETKGTVTNGLTFTTEEYHQLLALLRSGNGKAIPLANATGYRVYDLATHQISTSRDVQFHETIFPFATTPPDHDDDSPVLPIIPPDPLPNMTGPSPTSPSPVSPITDPHCSVYSHVILLLNAEGRFCSFILMMQLTLRRVMDTAKHATKSGILNEFSMVMLNNTLSLPLGLILIYVFNEVDYLSRTPLLRLPTFWLVATLSGFLGLAISFTSMWFLHQTGATTYSLVGSLNKIPLSVAGILLFEVPTSLQNSACIFFGLLAGIFFARAEMRERSQS
ncbi:hypothetical protein SADUNF_Sadunf07G0091400 [Salix dunnii]|uniref:Retroviral polymerase SH3-like domain-containing protein n=1 Tax=Salix dunnii TaxID=1413687 RepID=A0A835N2E8_9ROSI|nr:hypothetical protein SADUNF_Sadunf07G0091400 [Salix dunnii]